jgi:hypothetical protein
MPVRFGTDALVMAAGGLRCPAWFFRRAMIRRADTKTRSAETFT